MVSRGEPCQHHYLINVKHRSSSQDYNILGRQRYRYCHWTNIV